jgi:hypothetical protein
MGAIASLSPTAMAVTPGGEVTTEVRVHNIGAVVDEITVEVLGEAAAWSTVMPPVVSLFPGAEETVRIVFRPPVAADGPVGEVPFGVRVRSREDPAGSVVEEGALDVAPFLVLDAELVPRTSRGRKTAGHDLAVNNRGTRPVEVTLTAVDPDENLSFALDPPAVVVPPNSAAFAKVKVRATRPFRSGPPQSRPFNVVVEEEGQPLAVVAGMMVQEETIPRWIRRAAFWTIIVVLALLAFWFLLGKQTVQSAARDAAIEAVAPPTIGSGGGGTATPAGAGAGAGSGAGAGAGAGSGAGTGGATVATGGATTAGTSSPIDGRLFLTAKGSTAFEVPAGATLQVTDILLQNPAGDTGPLQIRRNGTPLLVEELANLRDLDFHFVAPIVFTAGQKLELAADCTSPGCTPGAYFVGFLVRG